MKQKLIVQQVHKGCNGYIGVAAAGRQMVLFCYECGGKWLPNGQLEISDDFKNVPVKQRMKREFPR
jgi:hypothetical protein